MPNYKEITQIVPRRFDIIKPETAIEEQSKSLQVEVVVDENGVVGLKPTRGSERLERWELFAMAQIIRTIEKERNRSKK